MAKPNTDKTSKHKVFKTIKSHKLVVALFILVLIFPASYAYNYYKDRDNAQMIKGLAKDLPALVADLESVTGLEFENETDCSITQEKFSDGVKTCEIIYITMADGATQEKVKNVVFESKEITNPIKYSNGKGFDLKYKGENSCGLGLNARGENVVSVSCITAIREANIDLAREVFLNQ